LAVRPDIAAHHLKFSINFTGRFSTAATLDVVISPQRQRAALVGKKLPN
jgi:hypothetical protein